jgi:hypothetical protein
MAGCAVVAPSRSLWVYPQCSSDNQEDCRTLVGDFCVSRSSPLAAFGLRLCVLWPVFEFVLALDLFGGAFFLEGFGRFFFVVLLFEIFFFCHGVCSSGADCAAGVGRSREPFRRLPEMGGLMI